MQAPALHHLLSEIAHFAAQQARKVINIKYFGEWSK